MRAYSVKSPKSFATAVYDMTAGRNTSERSKRFKPAILSYYDGFTENIETIEQQNKRALQRTEVEIASNIFKDLEDLREQRVPIRQAKEILIDKYNDPKRVTRALNTELHEQAERTKMEQSKFMGYTHKKWNAKDGHRPTLFHSQVKGKIVPVDSTFRAGGEEAEYAGDVSLPVGERINCRCYITYHNSPDAKINTRPVITPPPKPQKTKLPSEKPEAPKPTTTPEAQQIIKVSKGKNLIEKYSDDPKKFRDETYNKSKTNIDVVVKEQGFDAPPKLLKRNEFEEQAKKTNVVLFRGYTSPDAKETKKFREDMETGDFFLDNKGGQAHGRGMYFSFAKPDNQEQFKKAKDVAVFYSKGAFRQQDITSKEQRALDVATVTDDFKTIESKKVEDTFSDFVDEKIFTKKQLTELEPYKNKLKEAKKAKLDLVKFKDNPEEYSKKRDEYTEIENNVSLLRKQLNPDVKEKLSVAQSIKENPDLDHGTQAALMGFDAIYVEKSSFYVLLNRSKIVLLDNNGDVDDTYIAD
jgi:hypothetical protein